MSRDDPPEPPGAAAQVGLPWRFVVRENAAPPTPEVRPQPAMTVHCPHCSTGYLLPDHLVGPRGARVRCPNCQGAFVVLAGIPGSDGAGVFRDAAPDQASEHDRSAVAAPSAPDVIQAPAPSEAAAATAAPEPIEAPAAIAGAILDTLVARLGDDLVAAREAGRVLSAHGPSIMDAFAEYRRRAGAGAPPDPFRDALEQRCGVALTRRPPG